MIEWPEWTLLPIEFWDEKELKEWLKLIGVL